MGLPPSQRPEARRAYYAANAARINAARREEYAADPERRARWQADMRARRAANPEVARRRDRERKERSLVHRAKVHIGKCLRCGYDGWVGALQWAHVDAATKQSEPSWLIRASDERAYEELHKCVLICANCHWEELGGLWKPDEVMHRLSIRLLMEAMGATAP